ncbi:MAG TPA: DUF2249 domain-containing protein [Verrucomicrobiae bacterium]
MNQNIVTLDVREDLRQGREPFTKIMTTVAHLKPEEQLLLVAPFEPAPLFSVLGKRGFNHESKRLQTGDWEVLFTRQTSEAAPFAPPAYPPCNVVNARATEIIDVDARGLEPPQPLVKILEALATLPEGAELHAHTDRKPMHLLAELEERGFAYETKEQDDGSHITQIRR